MGVRVGVRMGVGGLADMEFVTEDAVTRVCRDHKNTFVMKKDVFCCDKHMFVVTKVFLSQQNYVCVCHDKSFVMTSILLSWQK